MVKLGKNTGKKSAKDDHKATKTKSEKLEKSEKSATAPVGQAPKKKFAWMVQGKSHNNESKMWFGDSRHVYYLTYVDPPPESPFNVFQPAGASVYSFTHWLDLGLN